MKNIWSIYFIYTISLPWNSSLEIKLDSSFRFSFVTLPATTIFNLSLDFFIISFIKSLPSRAVAFPPEVKILFIPIFTKSSI